MKLLIPPLRQAGHAATFVRDLGTAWGWLDRGDRFDFIFIDLALDPRLDPDAPGFGGMAAGGYNALVLDKSGLWSDKVAETLTSAWQQWAHNPWLP